MITTIPADYLMLFILGLIWGRYTFPLFEKSGSQLRHKSFLFALLYQTFFCMPIALYCYAVFPDWCWMYWLDSREVPSWVVALAFLGYYVCFLLGFFAAVWLEKTKRGLSGGAIRLSAVGFGLFALLTFRRLFFVGSLAEYETGTALFIFHRPLLAAVVFLGMALALLALIIMLSWLGRELDYHPSAEELRRLREKKRRVAITRVEGDDLKSTLRNCLEEWGGLEYLKQLLKEKDLVFLKPNLAGGGKDRPGSQTSPEFISAVVAMVRELKPEAKIMIGESGSIVWWQLSSLFAGSQYEKLFAKQGLKFINLSREERAWHDFGGRLGRELVPALLLKRPLMIDLPVAKTHAFYRMSGAVKNLFGLLPVPLKLSRYHMKGFADWEGRVFLDLYRNFPPDVVLVDGTVSGEGNCPVAVKPRPTSFVMSGDDALATDVVLARIMGLDPARVPYLKAAQKEGLLPEMETLGPPPETVAPGWKKASWRPWALLVNALMIAREQIGARRR